MAYTDDEKPEDFIFRAVPKSARQAAVQTAESRVTQTVKSALQEYLERFFSVKGRYRDQLKLTAPYSIQYETGLSARDVDDPTIYELQLARLWKDLSKKLPCILIIDQEFKYEISGLGGIASSTFLSRETSSIELKMDCSITLLVKVAAMDETTASDLRDLLVYIFGPLTILNKSHLVHSTRPQDRWEVRLPQNFDPIGLERRNVDGSNHDSFWEAGVELTVDFEGSIDIAFDNQTQLAQIAEWHEGMIPNGFDEDGTMTFVPAPGTPDVDSITVPETVRLGHPTPIRVDWMPVNAAFVSDNPRNAIVDEKLMIIPKRIGGFNIHLMDFGKTPAEIIRTWEVKVKAM